MTEKSADRENRIVENLGLVYACAARFKGRGIDYDDLIQAGSIGLIKAADRFDPSRGFAFSTYAVPLILGEMRGLFRREGTIKLGRTVKERARQANDTADALAKKLGRQATISELAAALGCEEPQAAWLLSASAPPLPLDALDSQRFHESEEEAVLDRLTLRQVLNTLPQTDRALLLLRYGCNCTQAAAGQRLGMTQVQVSRREKRILAMLREQFR